VGGNRTHARHIGEIDTENPIEFAAEIERSGFVMLAPVPGLFRL
jgi:hypothetical protein